MPTLAVIEAVCAVANPMLAPYGVGFDGDRYAESVETVIGVYYDLPTRSRRVLERCLTRLGLPTVVSALTGEAEPRRSVASYTCGVLHTEVVSPCRHNTCRFNLSDQTEHLNCLLIRSGQSEMDVYETAAALGMAAEDAQDILLTAMRRLREASVAVAKDYADLEEQFTMFKTLRVCAVCESAIEGQPFLVEHGVGFCSVDCCITRNTAHVIIESRTGIPADTVIGWVSRTFESVESAAQALNFPPSILSAASGG
jgi:hypothetical protein